MFILKKIKKKTLFEELIPIQARNEPTPLKYVLENTSVNSRGNGWLTIRLEICKMVR